MTRPALLPRTPDHGRSPSGAPARRVGFALHVFDIALFRAYRFAFPRLVRFLPLRFRDLLLRATLRFAWRTTRNPSWQSLLQAAERQRQRHHPAYPGPQ